jgi:hypothetical protein
MANYTVNPLIKAMNEGIANHKQTAKRELERAKQALEVKAMLRAKYASVFAGTTHEETYVSFQVALGDPQIAVYMWKLESFKDPRLTTMLERLMEHGEPRMHEYPDAMNKDFIFELGDLRVRVNAYVKSDSATCRRIQVDTKTVEEPVYKIICD